jgi:cell wall-associated NlpC family hydrolase
MMGSRIKYIRFFHFFLICLIIFSLWACVDKRAVSPSPLEGSAKNSKSIPKMAYTIQVGAFAKVENAARLANRLRAQGLNATYYASDQNLYRVRFGNYPTREQARKRAVDLQRSGIIEEFYIVAPDAYAVSRQPQYGTPYIRKELVKTAETFIGIPYLWGGTSPERGFDCSGLTMTVYQLNGLDLPRHSGHQFQTGNSVSINNLQPGDLVFFYTRRKGVISHVGIFVGNGYFIHAPSSGKNIRRESMNAPYYKARYAGARTYL